MPKVKARKKGRNVSSHTLRNSARTEPSPPPATTANRSVRRAAPASGMQSLFTAGVVALGCWGFAFTFVFLTQDPNRYLFGALAALLALMWSVNFGIRWRKWQRSRQA